MTATERSAPAVALYTVTEVCGLLRISRWSFYRLVQRRELQTITIGRRRLVTGDDLNAYVRRLQESSP